MGLIALRLHLFLQVLSALLHGVHMALSLFSSPYCTSGVRDSIHYYASDITCARTSCLLRVCDAAGRWRVLADRRPTYPSSTTSPIQDVRTHAGSKMVALPMAIPSGFARRKDRRFFSVPAFLRVGPTSRRDNPYLFLTRALSTSLCAWRKKKKKKKSLRCKTDAGAWACCLPNR